MNPTTIPNIAVISRFISKINLTDVGLFVASILVIGLIGYSIRTASDCFAKKFPSKRMGVLAWVPVLNFTLYLVGVLGAFYIIFEPSKDLVMGLMVSGFVAFGFAIKDSVASIMAGVSLLTDKPFQLGDRVTFQDHYGEIVNIGLHSVKLKTLDDSIVTIPNKRFVSDVVKSNSAGELKMMVGVDIFVPLDADLYRIKEILEYQCANSKYIDGTKKISVTGKEILTEHGIVSFRMTTSGVLKDARFERAFQTDFVMAVNRTLKENSILVR